MAGESDCLCAVSVEYVEDQTSLQKTSGLVGELANASRPQLGDGSQKLLIFFLASHVGLEFPALLVGQTLDVISGNALTTVFNTIPEHTQSLVIATKCDVLALSNT